MILLHATKTFGPALRDDHVFRVSRKSFGEYEKSSVLSVDLLDDVVQTMDFNSLILYASEGWFCEILTHSGLINYSTNADA